MANKTFLTKFIIACVTALNAHASADQPLTWSQNKMECVSGGYFADVIRLFLQKTPTHCAQHNRIDAWITMVADPNYFASRDLDINFRTQLTQRSLSVANTPQILTDVVNNVNTLRDTSDLRSIRVAADKQSEKDILETVEGYISK